MSRRGENIRKRKDGRWEARYPKEECEGGSKKYGSVYGKSYREAKEKREKILRQREGGELQFEGCLFKDILFAWQDSNRVRLKEASVSRYQNLIDTHILPWLGNRRMDQLSAAFINKFLAQKLEKGRLDGKGGLSASYVRSITLIINSAIGFGVSEHLCKPLNSPIKKPAVQKHELSILSKDDQAVFEKLLLTDMDEVKLLVYLTLYTGLRIGEICALRWEDIDLKARLIYIRHTISRVWYEEAEEKRSKLIVDRPKTDASLRCVPICSRLYGVLSQFPYKKKSGYILSNQGNFTSPRTFEYRYKKLLKASGIQSINYHALRHTFATRCIESGVDVKSLSEMLGHADVSITLDTYVHSSMELKRSQLEKLVS